MLLNTTIESQLLEEKQSGVVAPKATQNGHSRILAARLEDVIPISEKRKTVLAAATPTRLYGDGESFSNSDRAHFDVRHTRASLLRVRESNAAIERRGGHGERRMNNPNKGRDRNSGGSGGGGAVMRGPSQLPGGRAPGGYNAEDRELVRRMDRANEFAADPNGVREDSQDWQQMSPRQPTPPQQQQQRRRQRQPRQQQQTPQQQQTQTQSRPMLPNPNGTRLPRQVGFEPEPELPRSSNNSSRSESGAMMQLLPGWEAATDAKSGRPYYFNTETGARTWDWRKVISAPPTQHALYTPRVRGGKPAPRKPNGGGRSNTDSPRARRGRVGR